jgi:hypothetical protein
MSLKGCRNAVHGWTGGDMLYNLQPACIITG